MGDMHEPQLTLEPKTLEFDSGGGSEELVMLHNKENRVVTFKFKTTSPDMYSVKPRLGFIQPGATMRAVIQFRKGGQSDAAKKPQRFQVEYRFLESSEQKSYEGEVPDPKMEKEAAALATRLWKKSPASAVGKIILPVTLRDAGAPGGSSAAPMQSAREDRGVFSTRGDSGGDSELARKLKEKQDEHSNAYLQTQENNAKLQELRAKSEGACAISGLLAFIFCLFCVYLGVYLDKYNDHRIVEELSGMGGGEL